jgi:hypothetical protein
MKKILTLLLLFTLTAFLSGNQVVITQNYNFIVSNQSTFNFSTGALTSDDRYQRTNKIAIVNNKVLADPIKYHYAFFWDEADTYLGYYKTNKGINTGGSYLGQVNTQSIPLPLNAYSFALVRYDNDYILVGNYTIKDLFIDNNLDYENLPDFNEIPIPELNGLTLNEVFEDGESNNFVSSLSTANGITFDRTQSPDLIIINGTATGTVNGAIYDTLTLTSSYYFRHVYISGTHSRRFTAGSNTIIAEANMEQSNTGIFTTATSVVLSHVSGTVANNYSFSFYVYDLTALGLTSLTKTQLDRYFELYTNPINWIYYKTDGNVSTVDNYYYAASTNLVDFNDFVLGAFYGGSGTLVAGATSYYLTEYIHVKPNQQYAITDFTGSTQIIEYDINKTFLSRAVNESTLPNFTTTSNAFFIRVSYFSSSTLPNISIAQLEQGSTLSTFQAYAAPTDLLNLTLLFGVGNEPDLATMNGYYAAYEEYLDYSFILPLTFKNQTISYEVYYFDDGVSTEIEQLGSILIFTLIGFTLMIFGFVSRRRLFNLLAVGAFVVLGFLLIEFVGFIIILFGLIFINVYYTFFGEL